MLVNFIIEEFLFISCSLCISGFVVRLHMRATYKVDVNLD